MGIKNWKFELGRIENIVGKAENAASQHFLLSPQCFQKASNTWLLKVMIVVKKAEKIVRIGDKSVNHHFIHFIQIVFKMPFSIKVLKQHYLVWINVDQEA